MSISEELRTVLERNERGVLLPGEVVDFASDPRTELHSRFTWDDTEAARQHRLWEARQVIKSVKVIIEPRGDLAVSVTVSQYQSLPGDRKEGGYRPTVAILGDRELRTELLHGAREEYRAFRKKYSAIQELAKGFVAMDEAFEEADRQDDEGAGTAGATAAGS